MLIAFEGIDGTGKGTQYQKLICHLIQGGFAFQCFDFPDYDTMIGKEIGKLLSGKSESTAQSIPPKVMASLYAMDRVQHKEALIKAREQTPFVLINRYTLSNAVFQSIRAQDTSLADWVFELEHEVLGLPEPDLYLVFHADVKTAQQLVDNKGRRCYTSTQDVYESDTKLLHSASEFYIQIPLPQRKIIYLLDSEGNLKTEDQIHSEVLALLPLERVHKEVDNGRATKTVRNP